MKIAIIGAGKVGKGLGSLWTNCGHDVVYGVRTPNSEQYRAFGQANRVLDINAAFDAAEVVFLAIPWGGVLDVVKNSGGLAGKILIDPSNAVKFGGPVVQRALPSEDSGAELIQAAVPNAFVVKAFNQYGFEVMADPSGFGAPPLLLIAGNDPAAKNAVIELASSAGFQPVDAGPLMAARLIEDMARLWMSLIANPNLGRNFSFSLNQSVPT